MTFGDREDEAAAIAESMATPRLAERLPGLVMPPAAPDGDAERAGERRTTAAAGRDGADGARTLRQLVLAHYEFVWRLLRRLGVPEGDVDDAAQEVFIVLSRRLADIEPDKVRSFVVGAAIRTASTWRRTVARRREANSLELEALVDSNPNPEELTDKKQCRLVLNQILLELDLDQRTVFVLFELEQLPITDIAELLGIPVGTAASRLRLARQRFFAGVKRHQAQRAFAGSKP